MRQAYQGLEPLTRPDGIVYGLSLGAGGCAEHEMGIAPLARLLDAYHPAIMGVDRFKARAVPADTRHLGLYVRTKATKTIAPETRLVCHQDPNVVAALTTPSAQGYGLPVAHVRQGQSGTDMAASWNDRGFCLRAFGVQAQDLAAQLHQAMTSGDLLVSISSSSNPFARPGLCLSLRSRVTPAMNADVIAAHQDAHALQEAARATGIAQRLEAAGKRPHALVPKWAHALTSVGRGPDRATHVLATRHPVVFYLNPSQQHLHHSGWFTVEELEDMCGGTGPVMK